MDVCGGEIKSDAMKDPSLAAVCGPGEEPGTWSPSAAWAGAGPEKCLV